MKIKSYFIGHEGSIRTIRIKQKDFSILIIRHPDHYKVYMYAKDVMETGFTASDLSSFWKIIGLSCTQTCKIHWILNRCIDPMHYNDSIDWLNDDTILGGV